MARRSSTGASVSAVASAKLTAVRTTTTNGSPRRSRNGSHIAIW